MDRTGQNESGSGCGESHQESPTVADLARSAGVPEWYVYKIVLREAGDRLAREAEAAMPGSPGKMKALLLAASALDFAAACHREDEFKPVWRSRYLDDMIHWASEILTRQTPYSRP